MLSSMFFYSHPLSFLQHLSFGAITRFILLDYLSSLICSLPWMLITYTIDYLKGSPGYFLGISKLTLQKQKSWFAFQTCSSHSLQHLTNWKFQSQFLRLEIFGIILKSCFWQLTFNSRKSFSLSLSRPFFFFFF